MPVPATPPTIPPATAPVTPPVKPPPTARVRRRGRGTVLAVCLTALLAAGCGQDGDPDGTQGAREGAGKNDTSPADPATPTPSAPPKPTPTPTPTPSPTLPVAADGDDVQACADGTCEIEVSGPVTVPLPDRFGLGTLQVTVIGTEDVHMLTTLTRSRFSSNGGCAATITGPAAGTPAHVRMACPVGEEAVVNELSLEVTGIGDERAVLRVRPAA